MIVREISYLPNVVQERGGYGYYQNASKYAFVLIKRQIYDYHYGYNDLYPKPFDPARAGDKQKFGHHIQRN